MKEEEAVKRIEEQIGKSNIIHYDSTTTMWDKLLKELAELSTERKLDQKT